MDKPATRWVVVALIVAGVAYLFWRPPAITYGRLDFAAFYCGSQILVKHEDPYRTEPLRTCEHKYLRTTVPGALDPAPLPPYALAAIAPLSALPYRQASFLWFLITIAAVAVTMFAIIELTGAPALVVGIVCVVSILLQALSSFSNAPIAIASLAAAAVMVRREKWTWSALLLAVGCMEPHIALAALIGTFLCTRQMRLRIALVVAALAVMTLVVASVPLNLEYALRVIPAQAASELGFYNQYGLSSVLYDLGAKASPSLLVGSLQYAIFAVASIWIAFGTKRRELAVIVPMGFAVIGGTYLHQFQIGAALPLAFAVAMRLRNMVAYLALALISIPWNLLLSGLGPPFFHDVHALPADLAEESWRQIAAQAPVQPASAVAIALTYAGFILLVVATSMAFGSGSKTSAIT